MSKICPNCGTKNSNNAEFCQGCGQELETVLKSGRSFPIFTIIILLVAIGVPLFCVWTFIIGPSLNDNYLQENGINGTAEILSAHQTQNYVNNNPEIEMKLLVTVPGKEPYNVTYKRVVSMVDLPKIQPGQQWYVLVDPNDPNNVAFASE